MQTRRPLRWLAVARGACALALFGVPACRARMDGAPSTARPAPVVRPRRVEVDFFFKGTQLQVSGTAEAGEDVVIVARGGERQEEFSRKRRWGPIWIASGRVRVSGAPSAWLVFSSRPLERILRREAIARHHLDRAALLAPVLISPADQEAEVFRSGYFDLKRSQGLYAERPGTVRLWPAAGGAAYAVEFPWPRSAPPASYQIQAYFCRGGEVTGSSEASLEVRKVGVSQAVAQMSTAQASWYGLLCILASVAAGFGMDRIAALFGGKRTSH